MNFFLLIDKEPQPSSFDLIRGLRRITGIKKIGHGGTLDPFASGLMICAGEQYTRLLRYIEAADKSYEACIKLGFHSDTGDPEGVITEGKLSTITSEQIEALPQEVIGEKELRLPQHSAIKIDGKRAYRLAREGNAPIMPMRKSIIHEFEIISFEDATLCYRAKASKGTYIRSLSEYIAELLGCSGYTISLRRTAIGDHSVDDAHKMEDLGENWQAKTTPASKILSHLPALVVDEKQALDISCGRRIAISAEPLQEYALYDGTSQLVGIGVSDGTSIAPNLVFKREGGV